MTIEVLKEINQAEEQAKKVLDDAKRSYKDTVDGAKMLADKKYEELLNEGKKEAEEIKKMALEDGTALALPIIESGKREASLIRNIDENKLNSSINIIIERIVNPNGNR